MRNSLQMNEVLRPSLLPALTGLVHLALPGMRIAGLDASTITTLQHVTFLDLSENAFSRLPWGVTALKSLQHLDLTGNDLRLRRKENVVPFVHAINKTNLMVLNL